MSRWQIAHRSKTAITDALLILAQMSDFFIYVRRKHVGRLITYSTSEGSMQDISLLTLHKQETCRKFHYSLLPILRQREACRKSHYLLYIRGTHVGCLITYSISEGGMQDISLLTLMSRKYEGSLITYSTRVGSMQDVSLLTLYEQEACRTSHYLLYTCRKHVGRLITSSI